MGHDLVGCRPRKLAQVRGQWVLEVERMTHVGGSLYRPRRSFVRGRDSILEELAKNEAALRDAAVTLLDSGPEEGRAYRVVAGGFEPFEGSDEGDDKGGERVIELEERVRHLEDDLNIVRLRMAQLELRRGGGLGGAASPGGFGRGPAGDAGSDRDHGPGNDAWGARPAPGGAGPGDPPEASPMPRDGSAPDASPLARGEGPDAGAGPEWEKADAEAPANANDPEASAEASPEEPLEEETAPDEAKLELPTAGNYGDMLSTLVGEEIAFKLVPDRAPIDATMFASQLLTDEDEPVGAIVVDLAAAVEHGGTLMMISENARRDLIAAGETTEDIVEGMAEVVNVLSRSFNDVPDNPHIRVTPLVAVDDDTPAWITKARHRADLSDDRGGRTILLSR